MRRQFALYCLAVLILVAQAFSQESVPARIASCVRTQSDDVIKAVSARGELTLASGRIIRLLDIRLPSDGDEARPLAWLQSLVGRGVRVAVIAARADRWGRSAGDVAVLEEPAPIDIAELLVDEGFAMVDAGDRPLLCRPELLAQEQRARTRRRGLWASGRHGPVAAADLTRLRPLIGQFALVEGVVRSVGERRERTYLNFGRDWKQDLTITIPKRTWAIMRERGLSAEALKGRRVRARGVLEEWQGVAVEITAADMLEVLGQHITKP